jgi:hypothetical protein
MCYMPERDDFAQGMRDKEDGVVFPRPVVRSARGMKPLSNCTGEWLSEPIALPEEP